MSFVDWWKKSSARASEDYYKLRFDENEINGLRQGVLSDSAKAKFAARVKKYSKLSGVLLGGCLAVAAVIVAPIICMFAYSFYRHPSTGLGIFGALMLAFILIGSAIVAVYFFVLSKEIKSDLRNGRAAAEQGQMKIDITTSGDQDLHVDYSINGVEFKVLQDAIGDEINKRFLSPIINIGDRRTTRESYRVYYLPESKMILYYEPV